MKGPSHPSNALPASSRLAAQLTGTDAVGPWPDKADARGWRPDLASYPHFPASEPKRRTKRVTALGTKISGDMGALAVRMTATASATYARIGLGSIEARILLALSPEAQTSAQISKMIGVDRAAVCRSVQTLVERGLVLKLDGKARAVHLTDEGGRFIKAIHLISQERDRRLMASFSKAEIAAVEDFLGRLMLNIPELAALAESGVFETLRDKTRK